MPTVAIHQAEHLPWLGFFDKMRKSDLFVLVDDDQYVRHYYHNRNKVRSRDGWKWLTVPVTHKFGASIREVTVAKDHAWRRKWLGMVLENYPSVPWELRECLKSESLWNINKSLIEWMRERLGVKTPMLVSSEVGGNGFKTDGIIGICKAVGATKYLSGEGGKNYIDEDAMDQAGIELAYNDFVHPVYKQRFEPFVPAMSAIDWIFTQGDKAW